MADLSTDLPQTTPGKPPQTLIGIGVTGHRLARLEATVLPAISAAAGKVLDGIAAVLAPAETASLRLITALADGADSLVADEAIARQWTVDAVLPFARNDYAADFADGEARAAYEERLAKSRPAAWPSSRR